LLAEAREAAAILVGSEQATHMVVTRPALVVSNGLPENAPGLTVKPREDSGHGPRWLLKWLRRARAEA